MKGNFPDFLGSKKDITFDELLKILNEDTSYFNKFCNLFESFDHNDELIELFNIISSLISSTPDFEKLCILFPSIMWSHFVASSRKNEKAQNATDGLLKSILCHKGFYDKLYEFEKSLPGTPLTDQSRGIQSYYNLTSITADDFHQITSKLSSIMVTLTVNNSQLATGLYTTFTPEVYQCSNFRIKINERFLHYENLLKFMISKYEQVNSAGIMRLCQVICKFSRCGFNKNYFPNTSTLLLSEKETLSLFQCGIPRPNITSAFIKKAVFILFISWYRQCKMVEACVSDLEVVSQSRMLIDGIVVVEALKTFIKMNAKFTEDQAKYVFVLPAKTFMKDLEEAAMN